MARQRKNSPVLTEKDVLSLSIKYLNKHGHKLKLTDDENTVYDGKNETTSEVSEKLKKKIAESLNKTVGFKVKIEITNDELLVTADTRDADSIDSKKLKEVFESFGYKKKKNEDYYIYNGRKSRLVDTKKSYGIRKIQHERKYPKRTNTTDLEVVSALVEQIHRGELNLEHSCQRKQNQWSVKMEGEFIESLLDNILINPIIIATIGETDYVIDGKQRLSTLNKFIPQEGSEEERARLPVFGDDITFHELTKAEQKWLKDYKMQIFRYTVEDDAGVSQLFNLYNNQSPLTKSQKLKGSANEQVRIRLREAVEHKFLTEKCSLSSNATDHDEDITVIAKTLILMDKFAYKSLTNKEADRFIIELNQREEAEINGLFERLKSNMDILYGYEFIQNRTKALKKGNIPFLVANVKDDEGYKSFVKRFVENYGNEKDPIYSKFKGLGQSGTSKKSTAKVKNDMFENYEKHL